MSELGKQFLKKKTDKKISKKIQCQNAAREQKTTSEKKWFPQKIRPRMNYKWLGKTH